MNNKFRLGTDELYWNVDLSSMDFKTTKDTKVTKQIFGHKIAKEALEFAITCNSDGLNAYVRGAAGTGRKTLVKQVLAELNPQARRQKDYCYVHNFTNINKPRLIILEKGYGNLLKQMLSSFADFVKNDLPKTFSNDEIRDTRKKVEIRTNKLVEKIYSPFEEKLVNSGFALANIKEGEQTKMVIAPTYQGQILTQEEFNQLEKDGEFSEESIKALADNLPILQEELLDVSKRANEEIEKSYLEIKKIDSDFAKKQLDSHLNPISKKFANKFLDIYLSEIVDDFISDKLHSNNTDFNPCDIYGVNLLSKKYKNSDAPIIFEKNPTLTNLLGAIETEGEKPAYMNVSAGSLLNADGGFLVLEVDEALAEIGTWSTIMRALRSKKLEIAFEDKTKSTPTIIKPEPIPLDVSVILIGSHQRFYELNVYDDSFPNEFKVLVDLESELSKTQSSYVQYLNIITNIINEENLLHFDKGAISQVIEHGSRITGKNKISARFGAIKDLVVEASYLAKKDNLNLVTKENVVAAIIAKKKRGFLPATRFYKLLETGTIIIETDGFRVGQINGLAVASAGSTSYGIPARITTTVSPGEAGLINIEGKAELSGQIHTKGFQILGGLLRHLIKPNHPLSFSASIAFEQSYGGIDGDSASGAEACCLISAITGIAINQGFSMTGAIDQFGNLQAIGGVNKKIEGFFDCCNSNGLTGSQGVIIPLSNSKELMLKSGVVSACKEGKFHIYAVDNVLDALAILTETESCKNELQNNNYKKDSIMQLATVKLAEFFEQTNRKG